MNKILSILFLFLSVITHAQQITITGLDTTKEFAAIITKGTVIISPKLQVPPKPAGRKFILKADAQGYLVIDNARDIYAPGDSIQLQGYFKSVAIKNMSGAAGNYITFSNVPGQTLVIGDSTWPGGSWAEALVFRNCHYIEVAGTSQSNFKITGSNSTAKDAAGNMVRTAYFDLVISELSDNFKVHDLMIRHGGSGVFAKTEVSATNPATWFPNTYSDNFEFYNLDIFNTYNEAMYIGHTATYWNIKSNTPAYPNPGETYQNDATTYKQPIKLRNVSIHHNFIHDIGNDGIQTAAIHNLEVYNNELINWGTKHGTADNGGIVIGGRVKHFSVKDNRVHDSWGQFLQIFAEGGTAIVENNLFYKNDQDGIYIRGSDSLAVDFRNNTVAFTGGNAIRINGYFGAQRYNNIQKNLLVQPRMSGGTIYPSAYIYMENGGNAFDVDNKKFTLATQAALDSNLQPLPGSVSVGYGYIKR